MNLPFFNDSHRKGEIGVSILKLIIERQLKWQFRVNHKEHDFGIDAYLDIINDSNQLTGKTIAIQIKTGGSYFKEKNENGYVYRGSIEHLNFYLNHDIPVLIVLVNDELEVAYWCHVDFKKTIRSGGNWKITIPFNQLISPTSKEELLKYVSPLVDYVSQLEQFWNENEELRNSDKIAILIGRDQIESKSIVEITDLIDRLHLNEELVDNIQEKVDIFIDGFNEDSRELNEIPEVREWINIIFPKVLGWAYFLSKDKDSFFLRIMFLCNMDYEQIDIPRSQAGDMPYYGVKIDLMSGLDFLSKMYDNLNQYTDKYNLSLAVNKDISHKLYEFYSNP